MRDCLDARRINSVTVPDYEGPTPIQEILARCSNMKYLSTIDLTSSFWQVPLKQQCRDYTAFLYEGKCYRYTVTPFGLTTSSAALTRGLDMALTDRVKAVSYTHLGSYCLVLAYVQWISTQNPNKQLCFLLLNQTTKTSLSTN